MIEDQEVRRRGRRRTTPEIQQIVSEFKSGDLTQNEFCRPQGLTLSTLVRYLRCRKLPTVALENAGNSVQGAGVAQQVSPPDDAAGTENRQGSDGSPTGGSSLLDDAPVMGYQQ